MQSKPHSWDEHLSIPTSTQHESSSQFAGFKASPRYGDPQILESPSLKGAWPLWGARGLQFVSSIQMTLPHGFDFFGARRAVQGTYPEYNQCSVGNMLNNHPPTVWNNSWLMPLSSVQYCHNSFPLIVHHPPNQTNPQRDFIIRVPWFLARIVSNRAV